MNESKVSIIIPVYNLEKRISRCLDSVVKQTYINKEIFIIDDGSKDNTLAICKKYEKMYNYIHVISQSNQGVSAARNVGLDCSKGSFVMFIDGDDSIGDNYIETLMKYSNFDFVTAGYNYQLRDKTWKKRIYEDNVVSLNEIKKYPSKYIGKYYFGSPWAKLLKRDIIEKNNIRFKNYIKNGEDTYFLLEYLEKINTIKILNYCEYNYYFYDNSLVRTIFTENWKWKIMIEEKILDLFEPDNTNEYIYLLDREFSVLRNLVEECSNINNKMNLKELFCNQLFNECIKFKQKNGYIDEKLFIKCMKYNQYKLYMPAINIITNISKVKKFITVKLRNKNG